ncbi:MAG TPA: SDR family oxidoreductase [Gemmatimonadales bacterium]|nr:SDR family oxidoreductase [Gemmatimonadales bacterium]
MGAQLVCAALGLWLMAVPQLLGYAGPTAVSEYIVGPIIATIGLVAAWEAMREFRWANLPFGFWLSIAPWLLGAPKAVILNDLAVGIALLAFAPAGGVVRGRYGGGWSSLWGAERNEGTGQERAAPEVVVITGASAGVGRATALAFARRGASIGLLARGVAGLEAAKRDVEAAGGKALAVPTDTADPGAVDAAATAVEQRFGPIDIWINNAMASVFAPIQQVQVEEYRRVTEVTYLGYVHGTLAALKRMRPRDRGRIIQVGSALAYRGIPLQSAYCAAKHAVQGFCDSLRSELIHDRSRIRVTSVQMPALNTPQFRWVLSRLPRKSQPVPPIFQPEVAAQAILWAATHNRREVLVGWPAFKAVWVNKFLPGLGDWYLGRKGYDAQQTSEPRDPDRPHNLWDPVDQEVDHGAHGVFDDRALDRSWHLWLTMHRGPVVRAVAGAIAVVLMGLAFGAAT